eukprot:363590-Chlamydomonas_euryale.AAC.13
MDARQRQCRGVERVCGSGRAAATERASDRPGGRLKNVAPLGLKQHTNNTRLGIRDGQALAMAGLANVVQPFLVCTRSRGVLFGGIRQMEVIVQKIQQQSQCVQKIQQQSQCVGEALRERMGGSTRGAGRVVGWAVPMGLSWGQGGLGLREVGG